VEHPGEAAMETRASIVSDENVVSSSTNVTFETVGGRARSRMARGWRGP
jgi:hypothetical protein